MNFIKWICDAIKITILMTIMTTVVGILLIKSIIHIENNIAKKEARIQYEQDTKRYHEHHLRRTHPNNRRPYNN